MQALFVHGMGRFSMSGALVLWHLRRAGIVPRTFGYFVSVDDFATIRDRLAARIAALAAEDELILVGHSLGGVLIRAAVNALPPGAPRPRHLFLLGSPVRPSRLAQGLAAHPLAGPVFRLLTGDCGQLLASAGRMAAFGPVPEPTTAIAGVAGPRGRFPFNGERNDGIVALTEVRAPWLTDFVTLPRLHTILPMSADVARVVLSRLERPAQH